MPNIKSAKKRMRTSEKRRVENRAIKTRLTTARRRIIEAAGQADQSKAQAAFKHYCSILDKAVKKGTIKRKNAARRKSRAAAHLG